MAKEKFTPRGPWQATGMQKTRIPKDDPKKLPMHAEELKLKAARLVHEADELLARAKQIETANKNRPREDFSQASARWYPRATARLKSS